MSKDEFDDSCPNDLVCYIDAETMRQKRQDAEAWRQGMYNLSAFSTALSKALGGKKSKAKYMEMPMMEKIEEKAQEEEMTEAEKEQGREQLLMTLMTMQANFELTHNREE